MPTSKIFPLIQKEAHRQKTGLEMIPSENYVSENVLKALGSILTNKYSEGFPGARYYGGNEFIDQIEEYAEDLANKLFGTKEAIVQPYSGSPANLEVLLGLLEPGDTIMGLGLSDGGHLTHGAPVSFTGKLFNVVNYPLGSDKRVEFEAVMKLAKQLKPKLLWAGITAYPYQIEFEQYAKVADAIGAYLVADISHVSGLVLGKVHPDPAPFVHIITTTTHKTLRGPRGAMILITQKGLDKDPEVTKKLQKAVFPGMQGGPHNHQTAAIAVALEEASLPSFKKYAEQIVKNAKVLASELGSQTENHLVLMDLTKYGFGLGYQMQYALELAGITVNKNTIPFEPASAYYPSGIRLGTPALTTRGMTEKDMVKIAAWINQVVEIIKGHDLPQEQVERKDFLNNFKKQIRTNADLKKIRHEVEAFASKFPVPGIK